MIQVDRKKLFDKLSPICNQTLELACALCMTRTNYNVEIEHWLLKLLEHYSESDFLRIIEAFQLDIAQLQKDLTRALDKLKTGNANEFGLSPDIVNARRAKHGRWPRWSIQLLRFVRAMS